MSAVRASPISRLNRSCTARRPFTATRSMPRPACSRPPRRSPRTTVASSPWRPRPSTNGAKRSVTSAASSWCGSAPTHRPVSGRTATTAGTESPSADPVRRFRSRLLEWSLTHHRDLPWRATRDPWAILVSEVMLQQTQVDRVVGYYGTFLEAFPRVVDCAGARPGDVVRLWSGLGYNRRALNLHRAASAIAEEHGGAVPAEESSLLALPGIGAYTARAVLSFAFEADVATVDTNVVRVLSRGVAGEGVTLRQAQSLADRLLPAGRSWDFNQSMFDLGATVCLSRPRCDQCPLRQMCCWQRA